MKNGGGFMLIRDAIRAGAGMFVKAIIAALICIAIVCLINPFTAGLKPDEVIVTTAALNFWVVWAVFTGFFIVHVYDEWKEVEKAIRAGDEETFLVEAPKTIHPLVLFLYLMFCMMAVSSTFLYHYASILTIFLVPGGTGFLVTIVVLIIIDLDDPISGPLRVEAPAEWCQKLRY
jgi:hypothetical protein